MKIAIISDIHSNLEALDSVLKDIKRKKIKKIFCAGDIVGYASSQNECIELIKENNIPSVMGNHDLCSVNFANIDWFNNIAQKAIRWTNKELTRKNKKFLLSLPKVIEEDNFYIVHGSPRDELYEYIFPNTNELFFKNFFKLLNSKNSKGLENSKNFQNDNKKIKILIIGHTHIPFIKKFYKNKKISKLTINPGSVGQPRDGNNKASYCILDINNLNAKIIRINYKIKKTADMSETYHWSH